MTQLFLSCLTMAKPFIKIDFPLMEQRSTTLK